MLVAGCILIGGVEGIGAGFMVFNEFLISGQVFDVCLWSGIPQLMHASYYHLAHLAMRCSVDPHLAHLVIWHSSWPGWRQVLQVRFFGLVGSGESLGG